MANKIKWDGLESFLIWIWMDRRKFPSTLECKVEQAFAFKLQRKTLNFKINSRQKIKIRAKEYNSQGKKD